MQKFMSHVFPADRKFWKRKQFHKSVTNAASPHRCCWTLWIYAQGHTTPCYYHHLVKYEGKGRDLYSGICLLAIWMNGVILRILRFENACVEPRKSLQRLTMVSSFWNGTQTWRLIVTGMAWAYALVSGPGHDSYVSISSTHHETEHILFAPGCVFLYMLYGE
jgi:hypothetical protein